MEWKIYFNALICIYLFNGQNYIWSEIFTYIIFKDFWIFGIYLKCISKYICILFYFILFLPYRVFQIQFGIQAKVCDITLMRSILGETWITGLFKKKVEKNESPVALSLISLLCRINNSYYWLFLWEYPHDKEEQRFTMWAWPRKRRKDSSEACQAFWRGQERSERPFFVLFARRTPKSAFMSFCFTHTLSLSAGFGTLRPLCEGCEKGWSV